MINVLFKQIGSNNLHFISDIDVGIFYDYHNMEELEKALISKAALICARREIEYIMAIDIDTGKTQRYSIEAEYTLNGW